MKAIRWTMNVTLGALLTVAGAMAQQTETGSVTGDAAADAADAAREAREAIDSRTPFAREGANGTEPAEEPSGEAADSAPRGSEANGSLARRAVADSDPAQARMREQIEQAVARVKPALVRIHVVSANYYEGRSIKSMSSGSGAIVSPDGYVVTNHHVAGHAVRLVCTLSNRKEVSAELIGTDPMSDIAVIKLQPAENGAYPYAEWGDSAALKVGEVVLAMGSPLSLSQSVTEGIVSNTEMVLPRGSGSLDMDGEDVGSIVRWIGHDAAIYPGNSGGPLVDLTGRIVGVNEIGIGLGGAIPANLARSIAEELIAKGEIERSYTGLILQPIFKSEPLRAGATISDVLPDSPAAQTGLKAGDRLLRVAETSVLVEFVEDLPPLNQMLATLKIGEPLELTIARDGDSITTTVTPERRERAIHERQELKPWGMTVQNLSMWNMLQLKRETKDGVLVYNVRPGGPVGQAKPPIVSGDVIEKVNGKAVISREELTELTRELTEGADDPVEVVVDFARKDQHLMTVVKVGLDELDDPGREVRKAWIPVETQVLTRDLARALELEGTRGVRVTELYEKEDNPALLGLRVGDIVTQVNGQPINASEPHETEVFPTMLRQLRIGGEATLTVLRDREELELSGELTGQPPQPREMDRYQDHEFEFTVREVAYIDRRQLQLDDTEKTEGVNGVLVTAVENGGWTSLAGLRSGDLLMRIDEQPTDNVDAVEEILTKLKEERPATVILMVRRDINSQYLEVEPIWDEGE